MRHERHPIGGGGEDCVLDAASRLEGVFLEELLVHRLKRGAPDEAGEGRRRSEKVGEEECNASSCGC